MRRSSLLNPSLCLTEESETEVQERYSGFGSEIFRRLFVSIPWLRPHFRFFKAENSDDVWSICKFGDLEFGLQLDPDTCCICIWDHNWHDEVGKWIEDPEKFTIELIKERYLKI